MLLERVTERAAGKRMTFDIWRVAMVLPLGGNGFELLLLGGEGLGVCVCVCVCVHYLDALSIFVHVH